jgi:hypothetical protein
VRESGVPRKSAPWQAAPRPGRELADQGRQGEIAALAAKVRKKLA